MRNLGIVVLVLGIFGFFYASDKQGEYAAEPVPDGLTAFEALHYPAGQWQVARYGSAALAGFGVLMAMFPKGR
jgi:hypothetical protein